MIASTWLRRARRTTLALLACAGAPGIAPAADAPAAIHRTFQDLQVEVVGSGRPILMIPGLNSPASVWADTCAALQPVQCHLVQLPGFAGAPAAANASASANFLQDMRDRLLAYIEAQHLGAIPVVGHSLGGELALMMAMASSLARPQATQEIVDALIKIARVKVNK